MSDNIFWNKTDEQLPPDSNTLELIGYGPGISSHMHGMFSIMLYYNGTWWSECGTEICSHGPKYWAIAPIPQEEKL